MTDTAPVAGVVGVVLAGGASRRMGREKAALPIGGEPLLRRAVSRLRLALADVLVIGAASVAPLVPDTRIIADAWPGYGPLGALATALQATDAEWVLLTACDMPFTQPALVREMARLALNDQTAEVIVLRGLHRLEPLHAVYRRACLPSALERLTGDDVSLHGLFATLRVHEVASEIAQRLDPSGVSAFNANTPEEWQRALRMAEAQAGH